MARDRIGGTFMNVDVLPSGELRILPPKSRAGDHLLLRAEMDLIVGVTACSAELSNNGSFKPIDVEIGQAPARQPPRRLAGPGTPADRHPRGAPAGQGD